MRIPVLTLLFFCIAFGICAQNAGKAKEPIDVAVVALHFTKDDNGIAISIQSAAVITTAKPVGDLDALKENSASLICRILDERFQPIQSFSLNDPFVRTYEFPDEGNKLGKIQHAVSESDIIIRFPFNKEMHYLEFFQTTAEGRREFLTRIPLPDLKS